MSQFSNIFLRDSLGGQVRVGAFGKHPAWDDHIEDIGLATETLLLAKRILYNEGIAGQLASGTWDRVQDPTDVVEFDHRFVWSRGSQSIAGAIFASADGKGRTRFPLLLCLQAGVDGYRAAESYLRELGRTGQQLKAESTQDDVRRLLSMANARLNHSPELSAAPVYAKETQPLTDSVYRALVVLAATLQSRRFTGGWLGSARRVCFRLPAISADPPENICFWSGFLPEKQPWPCLMISSPLIGAVDLIAGEPCRDDFFCLRARETLLPIGAGDGHAPPTTAAEIEANAYLHSFRFGPYRRPMKPWWSIFFRK